MSFAPSVFAERRPFLYHFTAIENLAHIKSSRVLTSASNLTGQSSDLSVKRRKAVAVSANGGTLWLQTQKPLHEANIAFEDDWQMTDLLYCLSTQVFFWPGTSKGPIGYGMRHFAGNEWPSRAVALRFDTSAVSESLLFCRYNSGSPRYAHGKASPRGPNTFLPAHKFRGTLSDVVEVVVRTASGCQSRLKLPIPSTVLGASYLQNESPTSAYGS